MDLDLRGRTALITGASKGIGLASAECLAAEGVNVILVARTEVDLDAARKRIAGRHNVAIDAHAYDYPTVATSTVWWLTIPTSTSW